MRVVLLGDPIIDKYIWGDAQRLSPEAPVPILNSKKSQIKLGGAANTLLNLLSLGIEVQFIFFADKNDNSSDDLEKLFPESPLLSITKIPASNIVIPIKSRFICNGQQLLRVDYEKKLNITDQSISLFKEKLSSLGNDTLIVISDYNKGFIPQKIIDFICELSLKKGINYTVDPHSQNIFKFKNSITMTPNALEASFYVGQEVTLNNAKKCLFDIKDKLKCQYPIITMGSKGCVALTEDGFIHFPTEAIEVFDVTGAGDTFFSVVSVGLSKNKSLFESLKLANMFAAKAVSHIGAYVPTEKDILSIWPEK